MNNLIAFLRAQFDEDEQAAKAWLPFGNPDAAAQAHVARHDPGRVLREVEAKRAILDHAATVFELLAQTPDNGAMQSSAAAHRVTLAYLALPYADHPEYKEEWRP